MSNAALTPSKTTSAARARTNVIDDASDEQNAPVDPAIEAVVAAFRRGDLDTMRVLGSAMFGDESSESVAVAPPVPAAPPLISAEIVQRVQHDRAELEGMDPAAGADEKLLMRLVGDSLPSVMMLGELSERLTAHMPGLIEKPTTMRVVATALRDTVVLRNSMLHRMQSVLSTVAALRGQRRFLQRRGGVNGA